MKEHEYIAKKHNHSGLAPTSLSERETVRMECILGFWEIEINDPQIKSYINTESPQNKSTAEIFYCSAEIPEMNYRDRKKRLPHLLRYSNNSVAS